MEDYSEYIIAKREYEEYSDEGYTIIKSDPTDYQLIRLLAENGGKVILDELCYLSGSAHRMPLFRELKLNPAIEKGYLMTITENNIEYGILTDRGTKLYKTISTQENSGSTQETNKSTQEIITE